MTQVAIFTPSTTSIVGFYDRKGKSHERTIEGALHLGGAALATLKDAAFGSAVEKAENGRYRAAAEIIGAGFPSVYKAVESVVGTPWANKSTMCTLLQSVERKRLELGMTTKKATKKQDTAVALIVELRDQVAALAQSGALVIENGAVDTPTEQ